MSSPASRRKPPLSQRPQQRRANGPRYRRPSSFLRRSGIAAALVLLGIYALMQYFVPQWMDDGSTSNGSSRTTPAELSGQGSALYIFDGDTIALNGQRIRFRGMDTPETKQSCKLQGKDYACGNTATAELRKLIGKQTVTCISDGRDRYNRILAFCKAGNVDLNRTLVEQGWAVSYGLYQREEAQARKEKRGLWAGEFERPSKWRQNNRTTQNNRKTSVQ